MCVSSKGFVNKLKQQYEETTFVNAKFHSFCLRGTKEDSLEKMLYTLTFPLIFSTFYF